LLRGDVVWTRDEVVKERGSTEGAIVETIKYLTKGTTKATEHRSEFTHPLLVVLAELALFERNQVATYGSMRGLKKKADDAERAAQAEADAEDLTSKQQAIARCKPCAKCGAKIVDLVDVQKFAPWIPDGWGVRRTEVASERGG
jgi:hypothetical protein